MVNGDNSVPEKQLTDPTLWPLATWLLLITVSCAGAFTSWYRRVKSGHARAFNIIELIGELATSGFVGFAGFNAGLYFFDGVGVAASLAGMSAHFSTRLLFQAEGLIQTIFLQLERKVKKT